MYLENDTFDFISVEVKYFFFFGKTVEVKYDKTNVREIKGCSLLKKTFIFKFIGLIKLDGVKL